MKKVLIVICTYNSRNHTERIYKEIKDSKDIDLLILDNSSKEELISNFGNYIHIGYENIEYGGMHDYILNMDMINQYDYVGIFNNDIFGFSEKHFSTLQRYLSDNVGYISFSISPEFDKHAGIMHTKLNSFSREVNFIENVAPIYNIKLLKELKKYIPIHRHALIDYFMSMRCNELGMKNIIIDELSFHHLRSAVRKEVGTLDSYMNTYMQESMKWIARHPELAKYFK